MVPLLDAIRKFPFGVAARDMPPQESSVSPLANGDPATAVRTPLVVLMVKTLIVPSPELETNSRLREGLTVIRSTAAHKMFAPSPPVGIGEPRDVSTPPASTENAEMVFVVAVRLVT